MRCILLLAALSSLQLIVASPISHANDHAPAVPLPVSNSKEPKLFPDSKPGPPNREATHERAKPIVNRDPLDTRVSTSSNSDGEAAQKRDDPVAADSLLSSRKLNIPGFDSDRPDPVADHSPPNPIAARAPPSKPGKKSKVRKGGAKLPQSSKTSSSSTEATDSPPNHLDARAPRRGGGGGKGFKLSKFFSKPSNTPSTSEFKVAKEGLGLGSKLFGLKSKSPKPTDTNSSPNPIAVRAPDGSDKAKVPGVKVPELFPGSKSDPSGPVATHSPPNPIAARSPRKSGGGGSKGRNKDNSRGGKTKNPKPAAGGLTPPASKLDAGSSSGKRFKFPKLSWPRKRTMVKLMLKLKGPKSRFPRPPGNNTASSNATCPIEQLAPSTWMNLNMDSWLDSWVKDKVTRQETNNVGQLAHSFGAPNFVCGVDQFCDAGQPCAPVRTPEWYALLATQNLNTYMNAVLQGSEAASNILTEILPGMVADLYPQGDGSAVATKDLYPLFNTILSVISFAKPSPGTNTATPTASGTTATSGLNSTEFIIEALQPSLPEGETTAWTNMTNHLPVVMEDYIDQISLTLQDVIDKPINEPMGGLASVLKGGSFLGLSEDFSQEDLGNTAGPALKVWAAAMMLRSQGFMISVANQTSNAADTCVGSDTAIGSSSLCIDNGPENWTMATLVDKGYHPQNEVMDILVSKYGLTREQITHEALTCDPNVDYFGGVLPLDPKAKCLFVLPAPRINVP
ncbi:hypothetical protein CFO_g1553 [Ceratocystis platani]|uniref:DUF7872 domain-containing protein n=1 Tax=Ceratocystis fimbriata f. sp. platani TaxID=88771 RepID=A0A0F8B3D2_CERFI|nr:hypothetical protein CFO_g1553 [Ceratocystis platani]